MKQREVKYDYLRTLAVLAIIMVHTIPAETAGSRQWWFSASVVPVLLSFVGIYFMLSGLFILNSGTEDVKAFYWNRLRTIVVPFLFYSVIYYSYDILNNGSSIPWWNHIGIFVKELLEGTIPMAGHLWFMYVIFALYLCAPFMARMLNAMNDHELKVFLLLMLIVQGLNTYLTLFDIDMGNSLQYMIFKGWVIYFILGYALKRLFHKKDFKWFFLVGTGGFFITLFQKKFTPGFAPGIHDLALTMIAIATAIFLFFEYYGNWTWKIPGKLVTFISRHSYSAYLIHYLILGSVVNGAVDKMQLGNDYLMEIFCKTAMTFVLSLALAYVFDCTILRLLQRLTKKLENCFSCS